MLTLDVALPWPAGHREAYSDDFVACYGHKARSLEQLARFLEVERKK
jgi:hypothetical protein